MNSAITITTSQHEVYLAPRCLGHRARVVCHRSSTIQAKAERSANSLELKWLNDYHAKVARIVRPQLDDNATKLWLDEATAELK